MTRESDRRCKGGILNAEHADSDMDVLLRRRGGCLTEHTCTGSRVWYKTVLYNIADLIEDLVKRRTECDNGRCVLCVIYFIKCQPVTAAAFFSVFVFAGVENEIEGFELATAVMRLDRHSRRRDYIKKQ